MDATAALRRNASRADVVAAAVIPAGTPCRANAAAAAIGCPVDHEQASTDTEGADAANATRLVPDGEMTAGSCMMYSTSITS